MNWITAHILDNNLFMVLLGLLGYFFFEFKSRKESGEKFDPAYWFSQNWYNVGITLVAVIAYYQISAPVTKSEALILGLLPNLATDWLQDFITKAKRNRLS